MHRCMAIATGGIRQRLNPGGATMRDFISMSKGLAFMSRQLSVRSQPKAVGPSTSASVPSDRDRNRPLAVGRVVQLLHHEPGYVGPTDIPDFFGSNFRPPAPSEAAVGNQ